MNQSGQTACNTCPIGAYCTDGASAALPCPGGSYSKATGLGSSAECDDCPAGTYKDAAGSWDTPCVDCAARDAVVDIALVASSSSYETTASHEVLAANRFPRVSAPEIFGAAHAIDATCHAGPGHASKRPAMIRRSLSSALRR